MLFGSASLHLGGDKSKIEATWISQRLTGKTLESGLDLARVRREDRAVTRLGLFELSAQTIKSETGFDSTDDEFETKVDTGVDSIHGEFRN